jgi:hypothetical protein
VSKGLGFLYNDHFRWRRRRGGRIRQHVAAHALVIDQRADTGVRAFHRCHRRLRNARLRAGAGGGLRRQRLDSGRSVYNIILNVIDGGMTAQQAIEAPRFLIGGGAGGRSNVQIEDRIAKTILEDLEARGHSFTKVGRKGEVKYGYAAVAVVDVAKHTAEAGAEPRPLPRRGDQSLDRAMGGSSRL